MADENIKDFTISWILVGLLATCLLTFTISFMYYNATTGLDDDSNSIINGTKNEQEVLIYELQDDSNEVLNITALTNPEESELGSRDSVATAYKTSDSGKKGWAALKSLISWIFSGDIGKILLSVFGGILGYLSVYYIIKQIRTGT